MARLQALNQLRELIQALHHAPEALIFEPLAIQEKRPQRELN